MHEYVQGQPVTLAIGDGGNDVPLIQEARVGVGVFGDDNSNGKEAWHASDCGVVSFSDLVDLLLVQGRNKALQVSVIAQFFLYANVIFITPLFVLNFAASSDFSGVIIYPPSLFAVFSWAFVALPRHDRLATHPVRFRRHSPRFSRYLQTGAGAAVPEQQDVQNVAGRRAGALRDSASWRVRGVCGRGRGERPDGGGELDVCGGGAGGEFAGVCLGGDAALHVSDFGDSGVGGRRVFLAALHSIPSLGPIGRCLPSRNWTASSTR